MKKFLTRLIGWLKRRSLARYTKAGADAGAFGPSAPKAKPADEKAQRRSVAEAAARASVQARLRADVALGPSLATTHSKLQQLTVRAVAALGSDVVSRDPVMDVCTQDDRSLADWVGFVRARFPAGMPRLAARWSDLKGTHAGQVRVSGDTWYIDIDRRFSQNAALVVAVIAHELSHVLLRSRGMHLPSTADDEELTDATAALAGFGPVMLKSLLVETYTAEDDWIGASGVRVGYLSMSELVYLTALQWEYASNRAEALEKEVGTWHHYALFEYLELRESAEAQMRNAKALCFACGSSNLALDERIPGAIQCRVCRFSHRPHLASTEYVRVRR